MRTCQHLRIPAVIVLAAGNLFANDARRHHFPRAYELVELARAAPAEIGANAILSLLERNANVPSDWRRELAEEALRLAAISKREWPVRPAPGVPAIDNQIAMESAASSAGLDRLTLSMRSIEQLWTVDRPAAREQFNEYRRPRPEAAGCAQAQLPDVSPYYQTAIRLQVPPREILAGLRAPSEIAPAINMIMQSGGDGEDLEAWSAELGVALTQASSAPRGFAASVREATPALVQLVEALEAAKRSPSTLLAGWRSWLETGLAEPMCTEPSLPDRLTDRQAAAAAIGRFATPLDESRILGSEGGGAAEIRSFEIRPIDTRLIGLLRPLLIELLAPGEEAAANRIRQWEAYQEEVERNTGDGDTSDVLFFRQTTRWVGSVLAAQTPAQRRRAAFGAVQYLLRQAPHVDPALWQSCLVQLAHTDSDRLRRRENGVVAALEATRAPAMVLFSALWAEFSNIP